MSIPSFRPPQGTGKTLGYLLPGALFALNTSEQLLITTGTKALQHQAMTKDIPQLLKILSLNEDEFKITQIVGSGNHFCESLFRQKLKDEPPLLSSSEQKLTTIFFEVLFFHNSKVEIKDILLQDNLPWVLKKNLAGFSQKARQILVDFRSCSGSHCPFKRNCSYLRNLAEARDSHVIVGNHALMFTWPKSMKRPEYIIIDEAHKIEDHATKSYSIEVTGKMLEVLLTDLTQGNGIGPLFYLLAKTEKKEGESTLIINNIKKEIQYFKEKLEEALSDLPQLMEKLFKRGPRYSEIYWNERAMVKADGDELSQMVYNRLNNIFHLICGLTNLLKPYREEIKSFQLSQESLIMNLTAFETFVDLIDDMKKVYTTAFKGKENFLCCPKYHQEHGHILSCSPIDVGKVLHENLLQNTCSTIFTSATMASASGKFWRNGNRMVYRDFLSFF